MDKNFFVRRPDFKVEDIRHCVGSEKDVIRKKHKMFLTRIEAEKEASKYTQFMSIKDFKNYGLCEEYGYRPK